MNDIYATSMAGSYVTRDGDRLVEQGKWSYRGYGNAEVTMEATGELDGINFSLEFHSVETRADHVRLAIRQKEDADRVTTIRADIAGRSLDVKVEGVDGETHSGTLDVPEGVIFDGPSPIWLIHTMIVDPIPGDRTIVNPFIRFGAHPDEELTGGFYRFERDGHTVTVALLDEDGNERVPEETEGGSPITVLLHDDGFPSTILSGRFRTEIVRDPMILS
jgi:hypothetical protein